MSQISEANIVLLADPNGPVAEAYRTLRANLSKSLAQGKRIFCVVSAWPGDGKSMVCTNLAVALGQLHMQTLLVDGDLRRPTLTRVFGFDDKDGLTELLEEARPLASVSIDSGIKNLSILPRGRSAQNPANLLGRHRMSEIFREARSVTDCVIIDTPPLSACSDALLMGVHADAAIIVTSPTSWEGDVELRFKQQLEDNGIPVVGVILNGAKAEEHLSYSYGGSYGNYGYGSDKSQTRSAKPSGRSWPWRRGE